MFLTLLSLAGFAALSLAPVSAPVPTPKPQSPGGAALEHYADKKWTGDFDAMQKHRQIRILVPYSKTLYFVDRGQQRGLAYDVFTMFGDYVNKNLKKGQVRTHVVFKPDSRGDLIQALQEGRGDIAMGFLTITPERQAQVDFSIPVVSNIAEIVVTAPGEP